MFALGGLAYIIRNHFAQNPVHWIVGGTAFLILLTFVWRSRHKPWVGALIAVLQNFFRRKQHKPESDPLDDEDYDFDPSAFDDHKPNDQPGSDERKRTNEHPRHSPQPPAQKREKPASEKQNKQQPDIKRIGLIRKLEDLRDDPLTPEAERENAKRLLEKHVKSLKRKRGSR